MKKTILRYMVPFVFYGCLFTFVGKFATIQNLKSILPEFPRIMIEYSNVPKYNISKMALLVENRSTGLLAPSVVHFISVLPPDWTFRFMGSEASIAKINTSAAIRRHVESGKLDLRFIPSNMSTSGQEQISSFLTNRWVANELLAPAEWLLLFQTDSMFCAKHTGSLDEWLQYDWVGAPWSVDSEFGGNGGLSLRRVSAIKTVLEFQQREANSDPEDIWLTDRLGHLPEPKMANGSESSKFSVESIWHDFPLGYHTGGSGSYLSGGVYGTPELRSHIWSYCPEMKMTLDMDTAAGIGSMLCDQYW